MVSFGRRQPKSEIKHDEDPVVRQYRFLLRNAPPDAVEAAHVEALTQFGPEQRRVVLLAVQRGLVAGQRLQPSDARQIAHLIVLGERRTPNAFLASCEPESLHALAQAVIRSEACLGLFTQYSVWDGADPESTEDSTGAGFDPRVGQRDPRDDLRITGGGYSP
jgi:hypothetical protein